MVNLTTFMVAATALLLGVHSLDETTAKKIRDELKKANIIPEAIDDFEPTARIKIRFDEHFDVYNGGLIKPEQTLVVPSVWFEAPSLDSEYTLAMVNLDSNGPLVRHWIATNVKGGDRQGIAFLSQAPIHEYTSYRGPTPPPGSKPHRVAFVLFQQQETNQTFVPEIESTSLRNRDFFDLKQFAQDNHLTPISGAYFYTEHQKGFSQNYPPVSGEELGEIKEADSDDGLDDVLNNVLDDVGEIVGNVDVEVGEDDSYGDPVSIDVVIESSKPTPTGKPRRLRPRPTTPLPEPSDYYHEGLVDEVVDIVDSVLGDLGIDIDIGYEDGDEDDDGLIEIGSNGANNHRDIKQAGLVGDILDDILDVDINIKHHDDDNKKDDKKKDDKKKDEKKKDDKKKDDKKKDDKKKDDKKKDDKKKNDKKKDSTIVINLADRHPISRADFSEATPSNLASPTEHNRDGLIEPANIADDLLGDLNLDLELGLGDGGIGLGVWEDGAVNARPVINKVGVLDDVARNVDVGVDVDVDTRNHNGHNDKGHSDNKHHSGAEIVIGVGKNHPNNQGSASASLAESIRNRLESSLRLKKAALINDIVNDVVEGADIDVGLHGADEIIEGNLPVRSAIPLEVVPAEPSLLNYEEEEVKEDGLLDDVLDVVGDVGITIGHHEGNHHEGDHHDGEHHITIIHDKDEDYDDYSSVYDDILDSDYDDLLDGDYYHYTDRDYDHIYCDDRNYDDRHRDDRQHDRNIHNGRQHDDNDLIIDLGESSVLPENLPQIHLTKATKNKGKGSNNDKVNVDINIGDHKDRDRLVHGEINVN